MATSKIYVTPGTAITWKSSAGTEAWTPTSLATVSGRQGAYHDFGTASRALYWGWRLVFKPGATRVVGEIVRLYFTTGDGTQYDNDDGTGDIALSSVDKLRNVALIATIEIDENAAVAMGASGMIAVVDRYGAPILYNATANTLSTTAADYLFEMWPMPDDVQAAA